MLFDTRTGAGAAALKALWLVFGVALHLAVVVIAAHANHDDRIPAMVGASRGESQDYGHKDNLHTSSMR